MLNFGKGVGMDASRKSIPASIWWFVTGAVMSFGVASLLTVGVWFILGGLVLVAVGLAALKLSGRPAWFALVGAAGIPLYLAWLNRHGPGHYCVTTPELTECGDQYSPWPFVAVAVAFAVVGAVLATRGDRRSR